MDSFYGGKQGVSFVIKANFKSIDDMVDSFKKNEDKVWFGEYCLIDTVNKNDKDNGKIFRRGIATSTNAKLGGAEYIGQIVGPSSGTPLFQFDTLDNVIEYSNINDKEKYNPEAGDIRVYPTQVTSDGKITQYNYKKDENGQYKDSDIIRDENGLITSYAKNIKTVTSTIDNGGLVSGKEQDGIKWTWCNIKKANENSESWFYVGLKIPYLVNEFDAKSVNPYDNNGNYKGEVTIVPGEDNDNHPFYKKYTLGIPRGIKGDSLNGIKVITLSSDNQIQQNVTSNDNYIYTWDQFSVNNQGETYLSDEEPKYSKNITENDFGRQIIVYEYRVTDKTVNGKKYLVYVGDFNIVKKINLSQDGILKIYYTHDGDKVNENGTSKFVKTQADKLKWVQNITIDESNGIITLEYNTIGKDGKNETTKLDSKLRNITKASINNKGNLNFGFNTTTNGVNDSITVKGSDNKDFIFKGIQNVSLLSDLEADKHLTITYTTKTKDEQNFDKELIGSPINSIYSTAIDESNFHLLILFEDKDHRYNGEASIQSPHVITKDETANNRYLKEGSIWVRKTISGENPKSGIDKTYWWLDLGSVKDDAGILIGINITPQMVKDSPYKDILDYLNNTYKGGLTSNENGRSLIGKIATYGDATSDKEFYAYDYTPKTEIDGSVSYPNGWFYLGKISATKEREILMYSSENIDDITSIASPLMKDRGIAIYYKSISENFGSLPTYWKQ